MVIKTEILGFRENLKNDKHEKGNDKKEGEEPDVDISHSNALNLCVCVSTCSLCV